MAQDKVFNIQIGGVKESITNLESLESVLASLESKVKNINDKGGFSVANKESAKAMDELGKLTQKIAHYDEEYQKAVEASKGVLKDKNQAVKEAIELEKASLVIEENAKSILNSVGLSEKLSNYPCQLSGGQKQRVSIARALALKPRVLFFDEPTSALDPELTGEILKVIRQLAAEHITMIIVTHEIDFAYSVSDKVIFMDKGVIAEEGTPDEVLKHPKNPRTQAFLQKLS